MRIAHTRKSTAALYDNFKETGRFAEASAELSVIEVLESAGVSTIRGLIAGGPRRPDSLEAEINKIFEDINRLRDGKCRGI